jgi:RNA polymerase sigma-70 factor (ECF subfamily)
MSWEFIFPNLIAGDAPSSTERFADVPAETHSLCANMDSDAFAAFYSRSARSLWAYLARVSADPTLADDLMQESFVRFLCASRPEFSPADGEVAARRYLFRIATNLLRDHWRRPVSSSIEEIPEEFFAAADRSGQADSQAVLGPALAQMRPRDRQLMWLAHAEGYSHREIAQITGLASASIRLLLFRARRKIARILSAQTAPAGAPERLRQTDEQDAQPQQSAIYRSQP